VDGVALLEWISQTRSLFPDLRFAVEVGPVVEGEMVAGRWIAESTYAGGLSGSTAPTGTRIRFNRAMTTAASASPAGLVRRATSKAVCEVLLGSLRTYGVPDEVLTDQLADA
jgi:SnoaL-like polyketide cyclase